MMEIGSPCSEHLMPYAPPGTSYCGREMPWLASLTPLVHLCTPKLVAQALKILQMLPEEKGDKTQVNKITRMVYSLALSPD